MQFNPFGKSSQGGAVRMNVAVKIHLNHVFGVAFCRLVQTDGVLKGL